MLAYLCVIQAPEDDLRVQRIINNPPRGIGAKSVDSAVSIAAAKGRFDPAEPFCHREAQLF